MLTPKTFPQFNAAFTELLQRFGIGSYFLGLVVHDENGDLSDMPIVSNVTGVRLPQVTLSPTRINAVFVETILGALLRMLMQWCGLTLHQAVGALQESVKVAAHEIQQEQEAFLRNAQKGGGAEG